MTRALPDLRLDPLYFDNPKIRAAGGVAWLVDLRAIAYATIHLTDGFVPSDTLRAFAGSLDQSVGFRGDYTLDVGYGPASCAGDELVERLTRVGLLHPSQGGYVIHDFDAYQPTRADVERRRSHWRHKKRRQRLSPLGSPGDLDRQKVLSELAPTSDSDRTEAGLSLPREAGEERRDLIAVTLARLRGTDAKTPAVVASVVQKWGLPEAAVHSALEATELARARGLRSEPAYFVATLNRMGEEGQYAR